MWRVNGKILLRDNRKLSGAELNRAQEICHRIAQLVANRDEYVKENGIAPLFCYADSNWSPANNDYLTTFNKVIAGHHAVINSLRLFTTFFSGYSLRHAARVKGPPSFEDISPDFDAKMDRLMTKPDHWVKRWIKLVSRIPCEYIFSPPRLLGEIGWDVAGVVVNHDTSAYQERINLLYDAGIFDWLNDRLSTEGYLRILEIGPGYGALALKIKSLFPGSEYWLCDLPESLLFAALYLGLNRPDCAVRIGEEAPYSFVCMPNYMIDKIQGEFDLVINTLSFSEMSELQLRSYAAKIKDLIPRGFLFEQNQDNSHIGLLYAPEILADYFSFHKRVEPQTAGKLSQGSPNLWSNAPIDCSPRRSLRSTKKSKSNWWRRFTR